MGSQNNVLLVTIDSLRADYVYGDEADTPVHDALADAGTVYEQAFSQGPFTTFSMPSLFTSRYPSELQYVEFSKSTVGVYIDDEPTLPSAFQQGGYETAGFHSNPLLSNLFGFDRGFDAFDAQLPFSGTDALPGRTKLLADKFFRLIRKHPYLPAERINERALDWLDGRDSNQSFFLWVHYMDVHGPYIAKDGLHYANKYRGEKLWRKAVTRPGEITDNERDRLLELYRAEVEYTDSCLGDLLAGVRERGLWEDTVVVATADHGEEFGAHGTYSHPHETYDTLMHVPLVVRDPGDSFKSVERPTELLNVAPSLLDWSGIPVPEAFSGISFLESTPPTDTVAISEADLVPEYHASVRDDRYRYVRNDLVDRELLYDTEQDIDEQHDVAGEQPEIQDRLSDRLDAYLAAGTRKVGGEKGIERTDIEDDEVSTRLQDLGYLE